MQTKTDATAEVIGLEGLSQKIEQWRSQKPRTRAMPEELWEQASKAARSFGVGAVAKALRLGYASLQRRSSSQGAHEEPPQSSRVELSASGEFVELSGFPSVGSMTAEQGVVVEIAVPDGTRLTLRLKGSVNVVALVNALRWRA